MITKDRMKHFLERHHPEYWAGESKDKQTFLNKDMKIKDVSDATINALKNQAEKIKEIGAGKGSIDGTVNGVKYHVTVDGGKIVQMYPIVGK